MPNEALPPNSLQELRNRLILDGHIVQNLAEQAAQMNRQAVPNYAEQAAQMAQQACDLIASLKEKIDRALAEVANISAHNESIASYRKAYLLYERAINNGLGCFPEDDSREAIKCSYFRLLSFLNLFRTIKRLVKRKKNDPTMIFVIRNGFFFAFKENMKNTP